MRVRKFLVLTSFLVSITPVFAFAQNVNQSLTIQQLQQQITVLLEQVKALQRQVGALEGELGVPVAQPATETTAVSSAVPITTTLPEFTRNLSRGASGDDVRKLQEFLAGDKEIYPEGLVTGYFGPLTEMAIKRWQKKHGIEPVGVIGPRSRERIQELLRGDAGASGIVPPGLLTAPGLYATATSSATTTVSYSATATPAIPAIPAIPPQPATTTATTTVPAVPATPATPSQSTTAPATPATPAVPAQPATPTTVSNYSVTNITPTSATVNFTVSVPSQVRLSYIKTPVPYAFGNWTYIWLPDYSTNRTIQLTGLNPNTQYFVGMYLYNSSATPYYSGGNFTTAPLSPGDSTAPAISNIQVSTTATPSATITWTTNEASDTVVETKCTCSTSGDFSNTFVGAANTTSHSILIDNSVPGIIPLASGQSYYFRVSSADAAGNRTYGNTQTFSTAATATTADTTAPSVPGGLNVTVVSASQINLSWTAATDNVGISGYKVYRDGAYIGSTANLNYTDVNVAPGTIYGYHLLAYDAAGNLSAVSATVNVKTPGGCCLSSVPPAPTGLAATVSGSSVYLTWSDNATTEDLFHVYRRAIGGTFAAVASGLPVNTVSYTNISVPVGTYEYYIEECRLSSGCSASNFIIVTVSGVVSDTTAPSVPIGLNIVSVSSSQINLSWATSTDNVGVTGYKIYRNGSYIASAAVTSYVDQNLSAGTTYNYTFAAYDAAGNTSAQSLSVTAATLGGTTPALTVTWPNGGETVQYNLNYSITYTSTGVSKVGAQLLKGSAVVWSTASPTTVGSPLYFSISGVNNSSAVGSGSDYKMKVFDWDNPTVYDVSDNYFIIPAADISPPVVSNVSASSITANSAIITWTTDEPATGYVNYGTPTTWTVTPTDTSYTTSHSFNLTNLLSGSLYTYRVYSVDASGNGPQGLPPDYTFTTTGTGTNTDTTPPTVSFPYTTSGATFSYVGKNVFVTSNSDNVGVVGLQFKINGSNYGSEIVASSSPTLPSYYDFVWDTTSTASGTYTLTAVARDAAGNTASASVTLTFNKPSSAAPLIQRTLAGILATLADILRKITTLAQ